MRALQGASLFRLAGSSLSGESAAACNRCCFGASYPYLNMRTVGYETGLLFFKIRASLIAGFMAEPTVCAFGI